MIDFQKLKNNSGLDRVKQQVESSLNTGNKEDTRFWEPTVDKAGNGMAIIRFLPTPFVDGEDGLPWVMFWKHGFKDSKTNLWLIDNCLTSIKEVCPVCEYNRSLWSTGSEADKDTVRKQKRKIKYVSNIFIVSDPSNPDNEGQVKLFEYGKKIFDKLNEAMNPQFADESPVNPFDLWNGADFKLKMRNVDGYRNYDKSEFDKPSVLGGFSDDNLEEIWKKEYSLLEFLEPNKYNSYDKIKSRLDRVVGSQVTVPTQSNETVSQNAELDSDVSKLSQAMKDSSKFNDSDDDMEYFQSLAND